MRDRLRSLVTCFLRKTKGTPELLRERVFAAKQLTTYAHYDRDTLPLLVSGSPAGPAPRPTPKSLYKHSADVGQSRLPFVYREALGRRIRENSDGRPDTRSLSEARLKKSWTMEEVVSATKLEAPRAHRNAGVDFS